MKKYFALTLFLILSLAGRQPALADNQEHSYPWVLAGILNQISPQLGESKAMEMLVPCGAMLIGALEKSGIKDEDKRERISTQLILKYGWEMQHTIDWDSTIAEFMIKEVSFEELKQIDASIKNKETAQLIIKSEAVSQKLSENKTKSLMCQCMISYLEGAPKKIAPKKCGKNFKKTFDTFYKVSGNKKLASIVIDEIKNHEVMREVKSLSKLTEGYRTDLEKNLYTISLNNAIANLTEEELIKVTELYQSGALAKYMSVTRKLQRDPTPVIQSCVNKFGKWVENQDEWKQLNIK